MAEPLTFQTAIDSLVGMKGEIWQAFIDTCIMMGVSLTISIIFGTLLGLILFLTSKNQLLENKHFYRIAGFFTDLMRAFPFVILMLALTPVTQAVIHRTIGPMAASFALSIAGLFYFARLVEQNLREVPRGIIEASQSMGANTRTIITKVLLRESRSGIILSITTLCIGLLSYSAAAGMIGGGGLGDLAINYGYHRYKYEVMGFIVLILVMIVIIIQGIGNFLAHRLDKR